MEKNGKFAISFGLIINSPHPEGCLNLHNYNISVRLIAQRNTPSNLKWDNHKINILFCFSKWVHFAGADTLIRPIKLTYIKKNNKPNPFNEGSLFSEKIFLCVSMNQLSCTLRLINSEARWFYHTTNYFCCCCFVSFYFPGWLVWS